MVRYRKLWVRETKSPEIYRQPVESTIYGGGSAYEHTIWARPTSRPAVQLLRLDQARAPKRGGTASPQFPAVTVRRETKPKGRHPHKALSAAFVRSAPPGRHCDGNGLYLYVQRTGTRSWIQRLVIHGRKRELGLGSVALVSLAEAREQALANRKLARAGGDPLAEKRRSQGIPTFAAAAKRVVA